MKFSPWLLLISLLSLTTAAYSQTATATPEPEWYLGKTITDIRFDGLVTIKKSDIDGVVRPFLGRKFTDEVFQDLQNSLYSLDFFQGLIVPTALKGNENGTEVVLLFAVVEKPLVSEIEFTGNSRVRTAELIALLTLKTGDLVNTDKIATDENAVIEYYKERGYLAVEVSSQVIEVSDTRSTLVYQINEGLQTTVKTIEFKGLSFASESALRGLMDTKVQSFFDQGLFQEAAFVKDLRSIENYYWNRGYIDAKVVDVEKTITFDTELQRNVLGVVLTVAEGGTWNFGGFTYTGNQIFTNADLDKLVHQTKGRVLAKDRLEADYQRILDQYLENGYIFNSMSRQEIREENVITYRIEIVERPRAHIENILVRGNTKTNDNVVFRELPIEVGDVFSKSKIITGIRNLYNLQYFSNIVPETPQGSADGLMDLVLNVEEGKTANIAMGMTLTGTSDFPLSANVKWSDTNFLGDGVTVGVDSTVSPDSQNVDFNYTDNWFLNQRLTIGAQIGLNHTINKKVDQDLVYPLYSEEDIPDPYDNSTYVDRLTGLPVAGIPSDASLADGSVVTLYQYDSTNGTLRTGGQMQYDSFQASFGLSTGYSWFTELGRFGIGAGWKPALQLISYDSLLYRPANKSLRDNLDKWEFSDQLSFRGSWDTRDLVLNPSNGFLLSEKLTLAGGYLGGSTHFTRIDSRLEGYWKFLSWPVAEGWDLDLVLKARSNLSKLMPALSADLPFSVQPSDQLYIDGMQSGRGWGFRNSGKLTWINGVELRTPVPFIGSFLWWDTFVDHSILLDVNSQYDWPHQSPLTNHQFSVGTGLRIVSPQFPLALYFTKPFQFDSSNNFLPVKGDGLFGSVLDMKLVVAFGMEY